MQVVQAAFRARGGGQHQKGQSHDQQGVSGELHGRALPLPESPEQGQIHGRQRQRAQGGRIPGVLHQPVVVGKAQQRHAAEQRGVDKASGQTGIAGTSSVPFVRMGGQEQMGSGENGKEEHKKAFGRDQEFRPVGLRPPETADAIDRRTGEEHRQIPAAKGGQSRRPGA